MPRRIYIAGPMRGLAEHNYPAFREAAARFRAAGFDVVSPVEINHGPDDAGDQPAADYLRRDLSAIVRQCDTIALLPGWEQSTGARCEAAVALTLGFSFLNGATGELMRRPAGIVCAGDYGSIGSGTECAFHDADAWGAAIDDVRAWANATFGRATPSSKAEHIRREAEELCKAPSDIEEMADLFILLAHASVGHDLLAAVRAKLAKNKRRTWGQPDAAGVVEHVAEGVL